MGEIIRRTKGSRFLGWYLRYVDADGKRKQRASHQPTRELARRMLVEVEARIARGLVGMAEPPPPPPTVAELAERFLREYSRPRIKDLDSYRARVRVALRRGLPMIGHRPADTVQPAELGRLRDALGRTHAAASVRLTLTYLAVVYAWGVRAGIVPTNPLRGIERPTPQPSLDFLSRDEVTALLRTATAQAATGTTAHKLRYACVHLALHVGLRKGELLGLRWPDLDLTTRRLTVARSYTSLPKGGKPRHLRLPDRCVPILRDWQSACPPTPQGLVFPVGRSGAHPHSSLLGLPGLLLSAGCRILPRPWHALRHSFASHFVMSGGNLLTLQKILGHSDLRMTLIYAHLAPDFFGEEMNKLRFV